MHTLKHSYAFFIGKIMYPIKSGLGCISGRKVKLTVVSIDNEKIKRKCVKLTH